MKKIFIILIFFTLICESKSQILWSEVAPGVWKGIYGIPDSLSLLSFAGCSPKLEGIKKLPKCERPIFLDKIKGYSLEGKTAIIIPLNKEEQIYGFGLNFKTVQQRGKVLDLHVDHYSGIDNGRTHAPVPFYVSSNGYGILINSSRYIKVYSGIGSRVDSKEASVAKDRNTDATWTSLPYSDAVSMLIPTSGTEIYYFYGPSQLDVIRRYNLFCGGGALPPRWGLGFTQRTHTKYSASQVIKDVDEYEKNGFPLDFIGLEPGWQSKSYPCTFEWDSKRFPNPQKFVEDLLSKGIKINLWTNPYVSPDSEIYNEMFNHCCSHSVWSGLVPDLSDNKARELLYNKFDKEHVSIGISGYKIDEVDGYDKWLWPDIATFPSGVSAEQHRQTFGLSMQKLTYDIFKSHNRRTYGLVRGSNAGASSFPFVIYNDYYNHKDYITALINSGYSGVLWTPEVRTAKNSEEWLRRIQTVIFSPMAMLDGWSSSTKPWSFPDVTDKVRDLIFLRMQMMPYWYTEFARYCFDGIPPFRGMSTEIGLDMNKCIKENLDVNNLEENPYLQKSKEEIKDQYMAGEYLLVAPIFAGEKKRKVILPNGNWYDFYTGKYVGNGEIIDVSSDISRIPVFVKEGGIIPMTTPRMRAPKKGEKIDLEIRFYGKSNGTYYLYDDDGETFDYERGEYSWRKITVIKDKKGSLKGTISKAKKGKPDNIGKVTWRFMTSN